MDIAWSDADGRPMLAGEEDAVGVLNGGRRPAGASGHRRPPAGPRPPHGLPHAMPPDWDHAQLSASGIQPLSPQRLSL